jgi:hypothetical protein
MRPYSGDIEFLAHLDELLGQIEACYVAPRIAPQDIATSASGDLHPSIEQLFTELPAPILFIRGHPSQLKLSRAWYVWVARLVERSYRHDLVAIEYA